MQDGVINNPAIYFLNKKQLKCCQLHYVIVSQNNRRFNARKMQYNARNLAALNLCHLEIIIEIPGNYIVNLEVENINHNRCITDHFSLHNRRQEHV